MTNNGVKKKSAVERKMVTLTRTHRGGRRMLCHLQSFGKLGQTVFCATCNDITWINGHK
jgi:hypothetical protein